MVGTGDATHVLHHEQEVTVSCPGGDEGLVHEGIADYEAANLDLGDIPQTRAKDMLNLANPAAEFLLARGIGSIPIGPDSFVAVKRHVARAEAARSGKPPA